MTIVVIQPEPKVSKVIYEEYIMEDYSFYIGTAYTDIFRVYTGIIRMDGYQKRERRKSTE